MLRTSPRPSSSFVLKFNRPAPDILAGTVPNLCAGVGCAGGRLYISLRVVQGRTV